MLFFILYFVAEYGSSCCKGQRHRMSDVIGVSNHCRKVSVVVWRLRYVTIYACDRQADRETDGRTEFSSSYRLCITCSAVKICTLTCRSRFESYKPIVSVSSRNCNILSWSRAFTSRAHRGNVGTYVCEFQSALLCQ